MQKKTMFKGKYAHKKYIDSHLGGRLLLYDKHVDVEHFTSEMTHKPPP